MRVLDLFCGLGGWGGAFASRGHDVFGVDWDERFEPDLVADIFELKAADLPGPFDVVLASPPCECFSTLTLGRNWHGPDAGARAHTPKTARAAKAEALVWATRLLIEALDPAFWIVENPTGKLRVLRPLADLELRRITYCRYGAPWMKPTDLWGGFPPSLALRRPCRNDDPCSEETRRAKPAGRRKDAEKRYGAYHPRHGEVSSNGKPGHIASPRNTQNAINARAEEDQDPRVTEWAEEMRRIVAGASYESGKGRLSRRDAATAQNGGHALDDAYAEEAEQNAAEIAGREWNRKPKRHPAAAQNNGDKSFSRSAIRAMVPPELSLDVCIATEADLADGLTWRSGQRIQQYDAEGLFV